jgi:hypothetical protein
MVIVPLIIPFCSGGVVKARQAREKMIRQVARDAGHARALIALERERWQREDCQLAEKGLQPPMLLYPLPARPSSCYRGMSFDEFLAATENMTVEQLQAELAKMRSSRCQ